MTTALNTDEFEGKGLACRRGGRLVFERLGFALGPGNLLILKGPNGSGKSSLLRLAAGLLKPEAGILRRAGTDVSQDADSHQMNLHFIGHKNALKATLTVAENIGFWARFAGGAGRERQAIEAMGLGALADLPAGELSAGQQRRLALSRLFLRPAALWLLDEPTVGLDHASRERLTAAMARHLDAGGMIMAATHVDLGLSGSALELGDFAPALDVEVFS